MGLLLLVRCEIKPPMDSDLWEVTHGFATQPPTPTGWQPPWWYTDRQVPTGMLLSSYVGEFFTKAGIQGVRVTYGTVYAPGDYDTLIRMVERLRGWHSFGWSASRVVGPS